MRVVDFTGGENANTIRFDAYPRKAEEAMPGLGTVINVAAIVVGGLLGLVAGKAVLDFVIILVMTCSMGKGCVFSALPVGVFQGCITALAAFIGPLMTESSLAGLSLVGSILIFCVGVNLVWGPRLRVANMLPAIIVAPLLMMLPVAW